MDREEKLEKYACIWQSAVGRTISTEEKSEMDAFIRQSAAARTMKSRVHAITEYVGKCCACTSESITWPNLPHPSKQKRKQNSQFRFLKFRNPFSAYF